MIGTDGVTCYGICSCRSNYSFSNNRDNYVHEYTDIKRSKTSEFRQDWIDRVGGEVSLFTSSVADFTSHLVAKKEDQDALDKFYGGNIKSTDEITCSYNSLRLHLNKVEGKEIVDTLGELYEFVAKDEIDFEVEDVTEKESELIYLTQDMLNK